MKTPRELLFASHQTAMPKLDAICREVVATECGSIRRETAGASAGFLAKLWLELVCPCRRLWTGLAAVWILVIIVNISQRDDPQTIIAESHRTAGMMLLVRNQEQLLNESLSDRTQPPEADRPRSYAPKPRSEASRAASV
jgi:hypothetical protein